MHDDVDDEIDDDFIEQQHQANVTDNDDLASISSEEEECINTVVNERSIRYGQAIWGVDEVWSDLLCLDGAEPILECVKRRSIETLLGHRAALTTGVLLAAHLGKEAILKDLLLVGGLVNCTDRNGRSALHLATHAAHIECMRVLINHGANVNQLDDLQKVTPLHCAASNGNVQCLRLLIKHGADVNSTSKTPVHYAVESSAMDCVRELLESGAAPNYVRIFSETPLHVAASLGAVEIIALLLKHGASVNVQYGRDKQTPLHLAAADGTPESVRLLVEAGAQITTLNNRHQTPLHCAALSQASEIVDYLLKCGADPNLGDIDGRTPLHSAIVKLSRGCESIRLLIAAGADVNRPDNFGYTPLHLAALNEFAHCVLLLIGHGGDVTARTNGGVSALTFILRRTPCVIPKYIGKFDDAIQLTDHELGDVDCELKLDFSVLVPVNNKGETELLLNFIEVGHKAVLKHPLCETFLFLKWRRIRRYFLFSLFYHALFAFLFTSYVIGVFLRDCKSNLQVTLFSRVGPFAKPKRQPCNIVLCIEVIGYLLITLNLMLLAKEVFQIAHNWRNYIKQWENWLQWLIIIAVFCCVAPMQASSDIRDSIYTWQHHVAAIGIFLTWLELMMIVGRFPIFGLYVQMFTTVAVNFSKFLLAYVCLLIAFSLSFGVLFANYPAFNNVLLSVMKTFIMMTGELEFEDIFHNSREHPIEYPVTAHVVFIVYVLLVTVILTNLMVGLAVSDIQGLQTSAGLDRLVRQAQLVAHLESMLFSRLLNWIPKRLLTFLHQHALLLRRARNNALYLRPNDPREERLPKDLIKNVYELVAERKNRQRRSRSYKNAKLSQRSNVSHKEYINLDRYTKKFNVYYDVNDTYQ